MRKLLLWLKRLIRRTEAKTLEALDLRLQAAGVTNFTARELTLLPKALPDPRCVLPRGQLQDNLIKVAVEAQKIRTALGVPLRVSSAFRPGWYNEAVDGAPDSAHIRAAAIDLNAPTQASATEMKQVAETLWLTGKLDGLGFYEKAPRRIHIDVPHPGSRGHRRWSK